MFSTWYQAIARRRRLLPCSGNQLHFQRLWCDSRTLKTGCMMPENSQLRDPDLPNAGACLYRIRARGRIAQTWADSFDYMTITSILAPDNSIVTTLQGIVRDQSALVGIINNLHDLQLQLLQVECLPKTEDGSTGDGLQARNS